MLTCSFHLNSRQAYHAVGIDLTRMFKINKRSEIVTFDKFSGRPNSSIEILQLIIEDNINRSTTDKIFLNFPSRKWFKDRMGTVYSGYADPRLLGRLVDPTKQLTEEEEQQMVVRTTTYG